MKILSFTMASRRILLVSSRAFHTDNCQCSSVGKRFLLAFSWQPFPPILPPGAGRVHGDCSILGRGVSFSIRRKKMSQKRHKQRFRGKRILLSEHLQKLNHFYILTKLALMNHPKPFSIPKTRCCLAGSCAIEKAQAAEVVTSKTRSCSYHYSRWCQ